MTTGWATVETVDGRKQQLGALTGLADLITRLLAGSQEIRQLTIGGTPDGLHPHFGNDRLDNLTIGKHHWQLQKLGGLFQPGAAFQISYPGYGNNIAGIMEFARALGEHVRVQAGTRFGAYREVHGEYIYYYLPLPGRHNMPFLTTHKSQAHTLGGSIEFFPSRSRPSPYEQQRNAPFYQFLGRR